MLTYKKITLVQIHTLIINVVFIYIITVNKNISEEQNKKLKTKQTRLYAKSLMSTKEIMDFKKKRQ